MDEENWADVDRAFPEFGITIAINKIIGATATKIVAVFLTVAILFSFTGLKELNSSKASLAGYKIGQYKFQTRYLNWSSTKIFPQSLTCHQFTAYKNSRKDV